MTSSLAEARGDASPAPAPFVGAAGARATIVLLAVVNVFYYLDRQILNILAEPIARELSLSDTQIGLLTGLAFALFYTVLGIPLARLVDKAATNRISLISACLALWSGMTALGGLAQTYLHLLAARVGVAVGEAGCTPAAASVIADLAPRDKRSSAMAIYMLGVPIGGLSGLILGGLIADALGWRAALLVVGLPGLILAAVLYFVGAEPRKRAKGQATTAQPAQPETWSAVKQVFASRTFMWMVIGGSAANFLGYGKGVFQIIYLVRTHDLSVGQIGLWLGLLGGVSGIIGTWFGGWIGDRLGSNNPRHYFTPSIIGTLACIPVLGVAYSTSHPILALALIAGSNLMMTLNNGPTYAAIHGCIAPEARAMAVSVRMFVQILVGLGLGPLIFGMLSDALRPTMGEDSVRCVLLFAVSLLFITAFTEWRASRNVQRECVH